jgi:hypothetical protein
MIKERMIEDDGKLHIIRSQDVQSVLDANQRARTGEMNRKSEMRHAGSIPMVIAEQWSRECGAAIGTKEFAGYVKKKLMDGDWAKLRVHGF